jgi:hypothetical protein
MQGALNVGQCSLIGGFGYLNVTMDCESNVTNPTDPTIPITDYSTPPDNEVIENLLSECDQTVGYQMAGRATTTELNEIVVNTEPNKRKITYQWACFTGLGGAWKFVSHDVAKHKKVDNEWVFEAMEHHNVVLIGNNFGQTMTYFDQFNPEVQVIGPKNAQVELFFCINSNYYSN